MPLANVGKPPVGAILAGPAGETDIEVGTPAGGFLEKVDTGGPSCDYKIGSNPGPVTAVAASQTTQGGSKPTPDAGFPFPVIWPGLALAALGLGLLGSEPSPPSRSRSRPQSSDLVLPAGAPAAPRGGSRSRCLGASSVSHTDTGGIQTQTVPALLEDVPMPAVTVDDIASLPRISTPARRRRGPTGGVRHHCPAGPRGRGLPRPSRVRRRRPAPARPVRAHGPDGRRRVRAGRAQGHALAPAPRLRDGHVHDRWHLRAPGLQRWWRPDHQRRHAVDDGRGGHPAHRDATVGVGRVRRPVPRHPAVGQPARCGEVGQPALPGHPRRPGRPARHRPMAVR